MADLVALFVVLSVGNCGGPQVPLRGGRIDAMTGGAFGMPEPETNLTETLAEFASAGFNAVDSIGLTAMFASASMAEVMAVRAGMSTAATIAVCMGTAAGGAGAGFDR